MNIQIRKFEKSDTAQANAIWNHVVMEGVAFPQMELLNEQTGEEFFCSQSYTGVAFDEESGLMVGLYILHPNNVGRCGHICNTSYAVREDIRGQHIGEQLVRHSLKKGKELGFRILQFNAVVSDNYSALHLYEKLGFTQLGVIPERLIKKDGTYQDIIPHWRRL